MRINYIPKRFQQCGDRNPRCMVRSKPFGIWVLERRCSGSAIGAIIEDSSTWLCISRQHLRNLFHMSEVLLRRSALYGIFHQQSAQAGRWYEHHRGGEHQFCASLDRGSNHTKRKLLIAVDYLDQSFFFHVQVGGRWRSSPRKLHNHCGSFLAPS